MALEHWSIRALGFCFWFFAPLPRLPNAPIPVSLKPTVLGNRFFSLTPMGQCHTLHETAFLFSIDNSTELGYTFIHPFPNPESSEVTFIKVICFPTTQVPGKRKLEGILTSPNFGKPPKTGL